uniref:sn-1-specific diacylglycerol lipase n=1 Tax=Globodera rostochiensis TaxID=31243 RepID=A0A914I881_GLORO
MPSLQAFGRHWNIASDDFVFPGLTDLFARGAWVLISVAIFIVHNPFECNSVSWLPLVVVMLALNIVSAGLSISLALLSAQGSVMNTERRRHVPMLLYARLPIFLTEIAWTAWTTLIAFNVLDNASHMCRISTGIRIAVVLELFLVFSTLFGVFLVFNPIDGRRMDRSMVDERLYWRKRFFLCKMGQDSLVREAIDDIATLVAFYFVDTDFVLSDIIAGLLLLVHSPNKRIPPSLDSLQSVVKSRPEWMQIPNCLEMANRYLGFSVAVYGWPFYVLTNCACYSWCLLCRQLCNTSKGVASDEFVVVADNCCSCHRSAFMLRLDADCRLYFLSLRNRLFEVPFAVLVDDKTRAVVIAIRGSASFMDLITDLSLSDELLGNSVDVDSDPILRNDKELDGRGEVRVHKGMLRGARYVYETLMSNHVLEDLELKYPDYCLVVCGHSLGGGIGSLLALLLKAKYPDVRCYAFAPPGPVISENGIPDTERNTLSIVLGDDVIPRMTTHSIHLLKQEIEREIVSTDRAKYEVLIKGFFKLFLAYPFELHSTSADTDTVSTRNLCRAESAIVPPSLLQPPSAEQWRDGAGIRHLRPPGHLLHLAYNDENNVELRWIPHTAFYEIQLNASMIRDHWIFNIDKALSKAANAFVNAGGGNEHQQQQHDDRRPIFKA